MKKTGHLLSVISFMLFAFLFWASSSTKPITRISESKVTYEDVQKSTTPTPCERSYALPVVKLVGNTTQNQTIGGVTILCEVNQFEAIRLEKEEKEIFTADPKKPGYDILKVALNPYYEVNPNRLVFTIKIINNLDYPIEFTKVPIIFKMDGIGISLSPENMTKWQNTIAAGGETTPFEIIGPTKGEMENAKTIILQIQNIPTVYDKVNGNLKNFETFKWVFEVHKQTHTKQDNIVYSFQEAPVYKETCSRCSGRGIVQRTVQCSKCSGTGKLEYRTYNSDGSIKSKQIGACNNCGGHGELILNENCSNCEGQGKISYPKSPMPKISSHVTWSGWKVDVYTKPAGVVIAVVDPSTSQYVYVGSSNATVNWYSSNSSTSDSYPIMLEYQGKKHKIWPYNEKGQPSAVIKVDFLNEKGVSVKGGKLVD